MHPTPSADAAGPPPTSVEPSPVATPGGPRSGAPLPLVSRAQCRRWRLDPGDLGDRCAEYTRHPHLLPIARVDDGGVAVTEGFAATWDDLGPQPAGAGLAAAMQLLLALSYLAACGARILRLDADDAVVDARGAVRLATSRALVPRECIALDAEDVDGVWRLCAPLLDRAGRRLLTTLLGEVAAGEPLRAVYRRMGEEADFAVLVPGRRGPVARPHRSRPRRSRSGPQLVQALRTRLGRVDAALGRAQHVLEAPASTGREPGRRHWGPIAAGVVLVAGVAIAAIVLPAG